MSSELFTRRSVLAAGVATIGGLVGCDGPESGSTSNQVPDATPTEAIVTDAPAEEPTETEVATTTASSDAVETVVSIPGERVPENMAFAAGSNLYFRITAGEVRRFSASQTGETGVPVESTEQVGTFLCSLTRDTHDARHC